MGGVGHAENQRIAGVSSGGSIYTANYAIINMIPHNDTMSGDFGQFIFLPIDCHDSSLPPTISRMDNSKLASGPGFADWGW
jgi:hypothetical protein